MYVATITNYLIQESKMFVYMNDDGFNEESIRMPILLPFLMYLMFSTIFILLFLYLTFKNDFLLFLHGDYFILDAGIIMEIVLYALLWLITQVAFLFSMPTVSFGRKGFMIRGDGANLYQKEDLDFIVYSEQEGFKIKTLDGQEYQEKTIVFEQYIQQKLMDYFPNLFNHKME